MTGLWRLSIIVVCSSTIEATEVWCESGTAPSANAGVPSSALAIRRSNESWGMTNVTINQAALQSVSGVVVSLREMLSDLHGGPAGRMRRFVEQLAHFVAAD